MHSYFKVNVFSNIFKNTSGEEGKKRCEEKEIGGDPRVYSPNGIKTSPIQGIKVSRRSLL